MLKAVFVTRGTQVVSAGEGRGGEAERGREGERVGRKEGGRKRGGQKEGRGAEGRERSRRNGGG